MDNLYIIETVDDFIRTAMIIYFFHKVMPPKYTKYNKMQVAFMLIFYTVVSANKDNIMVYLLPDKTVPLFIFSYCILILIYPVCFRKGRLSEKLFLSSFYISIMLASSFLVHMALSELSDIPLSEVHIKINYRISIAMLINRFIQFIFITLFLAKMNNRNFIQYIKDKTLYLGSIILIFNNSLLFTVERYIFKNLDKVNIDSIMVVFVLCAIYILSIYILNALSKEIEEKFILKINLDRKMYDEKIIEMYSEIVGWKHDFKNHINMVLGLLEVSTKEDVISYIKEIDNSITKLDKNIYTDNIAINCILINKMKIINEENIKSSLDIKVDSEIKISNVDMCIILGNLLDNSIEACSKIEGYKFIDLKIVSSKERLVIKISNNTNGNVNEMNGRFLTTKNNEINGIGLIQIDNIVKKYNGYINRKHENNVFITSIMIQFEDKKSNLTTN